MACKCSTLYYILFQFLRPFRQVHVFTLMTKSPTSAGQPQHPALASYMKTAVNRNYLIRIHNIRGKVKPYNEIYIYLLDRYNSIYSYIYTDIYIFQVLLLLACPLSICEDVQNWSSHTQQREL